MHNLALKSAFSAERAIFGDDSAVALIPRFNDGAIGDVDSLLAVLYQTPILDTLPDPYGDSILNSGAIATRARVRVVACILVGLESITIQPVWLRIHVPTWWPCGLWSTWW